MMDTSNRSAGIREACSDKFQGFPHSPPDTDKEYTDSSSEPSDIEAATLWPEDAKPDVVNSPLYPLPPKCKSDNTVLTEDLKTPDSHVVRDPRLIRLTGIHPFNAEAPLSDLYDEGFLTTKDLHYVRNHGAVPKVENSAIMEWDFTIEGLVDNPIHITLAQLIRDYDQVTYPVTLVCAGNRRKEQNMVRKTRGFSWGAAGLSTALWTGVAISDVLKTAAPQRGARYVCFEGADRLPNGYYGTSIKLSWAMDAERGVILAHGMNGEILPPDHGRPLRVVIPGQIGGRSVKWLKRIIITKEPSDNWYHIYDNRVLPTMIDPEMSADLPDVWRDERYAIYDLNTNSAICYPTHNEELSLHETNGTSYKMRGYAYAGGGKRITRVEITLDRGRTWELATLTYPEDRYRLAPEGDTLFGGRIGTFWRESSFCWCFWELDILISRLQATDDLMVRAMDEAMMVQPRDMYWSVLGMMNNPWFRVVIHLEGSRLRFEHPTQPALISGGWMERIKKAGGDLTNGYWGEQRTGEAVVSRLVEQSKEICMTNDKLNRAITLEELKGHGSELEPWFVVNGQVYDGTSFLEGHPGGATSIIGAAGQDVSEEFLAIHSENAKATLSNYHIGTLDQASQAALLLSSDNNNEHSDQHDAQRTTFLSPKSWSKATLTRKKPISPDTTIFTFTFTPPHAHQTTGLPIGQHLTLRLRDPATREAILRAYTPISAPETRGTLDLLIKVYRADSNRNSNNSSRSERSGGKMTQALDSLPLGHAVEFKGPHGKFEYVGRGQCRVSGHLRPPKHNQTATTTTTTTTTTTSSSSSSNSINRFIMLSAGSGITPILAVLRAVLRDPAADSTACVVLDGNRTEEDILCRAELDGLVKEANEQQKKKKDINENDNKNGKPPRCRLHYVLSRPGPAWTGARGRIDRELVEAEVGPCMSEDGGEMVLVCGPKAFEASVLEIFMALGWKRDDMVFF